MVSFRATRPIKLINQKGFSRLAWLSGVSFRRDLRKPCVFFNGSNNFSLPPHN